MEEEEEEEHHQQIHVIVMLLQLVFVEVLQQMLQPHVEIIKEMDALQDVLHLHHLHLNQYLLLHNVIVKDKQEHNVELHQQAEQLDAEIEYITHAAINVEDHHLLHLHHQIHVIVKQAQSDNVEMDQHLEQPHAETTAFVIVKEDVLHQHQHLNHLQIHVIVKELQFKDAVMDQHREQLHVEITKLHNVI
jgi:hypothetical protein